MTALLWTMLAIPQVFGLNDQLILCRPQEVWIFNSSKPGVAPLKLRGQILARCRQGFILEEQGQLRFWSFQTQSATALPALTKKVFATDLPDFDYPALFDTTSLWFFDQGWRNLPMPIQVEYITPNSALNTQQGLNLIFPQVVSVGIAAALVYQAKSGALLHYANLHQTGKKLQQDKKLRLLRSGSYLFWIGNKDQEQVQLAHTSNPLHPLDRQKISELERDSPYVLEGKCLWLLTFDIGLSSFGSIWRTSLVSVKPVAVRHSGNRISLNDQIASQTVPVKLNIRTTDNGSLKLDASPGFEMLPVLGWDGLVLLWDRTLLWVTPEGKIGHQAPPAEGMVAVSYAEGKLWRWDAEGVAQVWLEKLP